MSKATRFVGLDVHAATISVAVADAEEEVRSVGVVPNRPESVSRLVKKLGPAARLRVCYEAGPCGYVLYRQLRDLGAHCDVVAPTLVPVKAGDRVKTDRRDARKLAHCYRAGDLTPVWVPDGEHESLRDLVRAREAAKKDQLRARHRLQKFLLRQGLQRPEGMSAWTLKHLLWIRGHQFEHATRQAAFQDYLYEVGRARERIEQLEKSIEEALDQVPEPMSALIKGLQALRGVGQLSAATIVAEVGPLSRFPHPRQLMAYAGLVPSEHSSGGKTIHGGITKTGNAHLRRVLVEAAWAYRHRPSLWGALRRRQGGVSQEIKTIAWKAQLRLHRRYQRLQARGKPKQYIMTVVARELAGFLWAVALEVERQRDQKKAA
jgi:transposase